MFNLGKSRAWICLGLIIVMGCMVAGSASAGLFGWKLGKSKAKTKAVSRAPKHIVQKSLVIFPLDSGGADVSKALCVEVSSAIRSSLSGERQYMPLLYSDRLAPIQRARTESDSGMYSSTQDTTTKFSENREKTLIASRILAADYCLVGFIDECKVSNKLAEITASVDLIDVKTGKLIRTMLVQGRTPEQSTVADDDEARALAAGDVVAKIKTQILEYNQSPQPATEKKPVENAVKAESTPAPAPVSSAPVPQPTAEAPVPSVADDSAGSPPPAQ